MKKTSIAVGGNGVGFPALLALVFITLKLTGTISWSWIWVLSPLWISFCLGVALLLVFFMIHLFFLRNS